MSELKFFLLMGILTQNLNTMDFVKFLEKKSKTSHLDRSGHIVGDILQNHEKRKEKVKKNEKKFNKVENQASMDKTNFFFSTLPFNPWAISATWLHVGAPQKIHEKCT
jgi:hypothetical protein